MLRPAASTLALLLPLRVAAQPAIDGTVVDSTGHPIVGALVSATSMRGDALGTARSDSAGRFVVRVRADSVRVLVRRLGWQPLETPVMAVAALRGVELELEPLPQRMRAVVVDGSRYRGGFEARMAAGGYRKFFLDSTAIADKAAREDVRSVSSLVERIPFMKRGTTCVLADGWFAGYGALPAPGRPSVYDLGSVAELRGIEVYEDANAAPAELRRVAAFRPARGPDCARLVVLWTKAGFSW